MEVFAVLEDFERPPLEIVRKLWRIPTAVLSDAMANLNTMDSGIKAMGAVARVCGPACTAVTRSGDFVATLKALSLAHPGDVLVIDNQGDADTAVWGEITSLEAKLKGLAGTVADGLVRDVEGIRKLGYPVFARGASPRVNARNAIGEVNVTVGCGGVVVSPGDIIVGDADGLVVVPRLKAAVIYEAALSIERFERTLIRQIKSKRSQVEIFGLEKEMAAIRRAFEEAHRLP